MANPLPIINLAALQLNCLLLYINNTIYHTQRARIYHIANLLSISRKKRRRERDSRDDLDSAKKDECLVG